MTETATLPIAECAGRYSLTFTVPGDAPCLDGHFPGDSLVPAAQLLAWLQVAIARVDSRLANGGRFDRVKFLAPVRGESELILEWEAFNAGWRMAARVGGTIALRADLYPDGV